MANALPLTLSLLDRVSFKRQDDGYLRTLLYDEGARFIPIEKQFNLIDKHSRQAVILKAADLPISQLSPEDFIYLGTETERENPRHFFSCQLSLWRHTPDWEFADIKSHIPAMNAQHASIMAYARALNYWHYTHRYCGKCGSSTKSKSAGHVRVCESQSCNRSWFPRTDPAVITAIIFEDRLLLGRNASWPENRFSVIAGFVEPGESLEQAVIREAYEETGVKIRAAHYLASQPWPFPASLMVGFWAEAESQRIALHDNELELARWWTREQLDSAVERGELVLPSQASISNWLIEQWRNGNIP